MTQREIFTSDSLNYSVVVKDRQTKLPRDLSTATVVAIARKTVPAGVPNVVGVAEITDETEGIISVDFPAQSFSVGSWSIQTRVTDGTEVQTVSDVSINVKQANLAP